MTSRFMQIFSLKTSLDKLCENMVFRLPVFPRIRTESAIISLYGGRRFSENPCSRAFHAVHTTSNNTDQYLPHFLHNWDVSSNQIINLGSGPEIEDLQICRSITTSIISKLSFMNAGTHIIFLKWLWLHFMRWYDVSLFYFILKFWKVNWGINITAYVLFKKTRRWMGQKGFI